MLRKALPMSLSVARLAATLARTIAETVNLAKCLMRFVLSAVHPVRFPSSRVVTVLYTAATVFPKKVSEDSTKSAL